MQPIVHGLEDKYAAKIDFVYLDIDDPTSEAAKRKLGYRVWPDLSDWRRRQHRPALDRLCGRQSN
jgi:hypothetical protein